MNLLRNKKGQGMIEYLMIAAFAVALAVYLYQHVKSPAEKSIDNVATQVGSTGN